MSGKKGGVVLAGCGFLDGAEIHEACCTLLALDRAGADILCMAPNVSQMHVVDHGAGAPEGERERREEQPATERDDCQPELFRFNSLNDAGTLRADFVSLSYGDIK